jgi:hypothetical protein
MLAPMASIATAASVPNGASSNFIMRTYIWLALQGPLVLRITWYCHLGWFETCKRD